MERKQNKLNLDTCYKLTNEPPGRCTCGIKMAIGVPGYNTFIFVSTPLHSSFGKFVQMIAMKLLLLSFILSMKLKDIKPHIGQKSCKLTL